ncbi:MAG: DUF362 domain-containing protein [Planctomycetes bacterium]|nr:DUF362 domain-containing protein [Planctomycetota bacterium]
MDRREFLKHVAAWSVGATAVPPLFEITPGLLAAEAAPPIVSVAKGKDYEDLVTKTLKPLGGMGAFVKKGQTVVVKPNIAWDRSPEQGANTHPLVVKQVVREVLKAGASRVLVFDRPCQDQRRTYANSGIRKAVESIDDSRVTCTYVDDRKWVPVKIEKGKAVKEWQFYKDALEADCYINVPIAKHHRSATLTIGLKNILGIVGGNRGELHTSLGQKLADLNTVVRPHLTIVDATRILLRNGPVGGNLEDVKVLDTIIASPDTVAVDAYATTLFDRKPEEIESTKAGAAHGLGVMDLDQIKLIEA